jgi:hypothetical protein
MQTVKVMGIWLILPRVVSLFIQFVSFCIVVVLTRVQAGWRAGGMALVVFIRFVWVLFGFVWFLFGTESIASVWYNGFFKQNRVIFFVWFSSYSFTQELSPFLPIVGS